MYRWVPANYFAKHWNGDLSLPVACCGGGASIIILVQAFAFTFSTLVDANFSAAAFTALCALLFLGFAVLCLWYAVGVWHASCQHTRRGGRAIWAGVATVAVMVGLARLLVEFVSMPLPIVSEHVRIALGDNGFGDSHFHLSSNGTELKFSGGIRIGTAREFQHMLKAASQIRVLHLSSGGGRISEADRMAAEIRMRNLITYVSDDCHSACITLFLAGRERWISKQGTLGFHEPHVPGLKSKHLEALIQREMLKLTSVGVDADFVSKALSTPHTSIWTPTHTELAAARVVTGVVDSHGSTVEKFVNK